MRLDPQNTAAEKLCEDLGFAKTGASKTARPVARLEVNGS